MANNLLCIKQSSQKSAQSVSDKTMQKIGLQTLLDGSIKQG